MRFSHKKSKLFLTHIFSDNPGQKPTGQYDILSTFVIKVKIRKDFSHPHSPLAMLCSLMVCEHAGITLIMTRLF